MSWSFVADGSEQRIFNNSQSPVSAMPCTLACWFLVAGSSLGQENLVQLTDNDGSDSVRIGLMENRRVRAGYTSASANSNSTTTATANLSSWNHACGVFVNDSSRTAYLNGATGAENTVTLLPTVPYTQFCIGTRLLAGSFTNYFGGRIAEVGVWDVILSADEIASLAKGFSCNLIRPQSLVFYAPLVRDLVDFSRGISLENRNDGATVAGDHPRIYT